MIKPHLITEYLKIFVNWIFSHLLLFVILFQIHTVASFENQI